MSGGPDTPPGQKRVVVLREGPPRGRGKTLDGVLGVVGALLLILAVVLVVALPEKETPDPQYRVEYPGTVHELVGSTVRSEDVLDDGVLLPGESRAIDLAVEVEHNNVYEIVGQFFFEEDREETLPDVFIVELVDPDGVVVQVSNPQPTLPVCDVNDENGGNGYSTPGEYYVTCERNQGQLTRVAFNLGGKPMDRIVTLEGGNSSLEAVEAAVAAQDTVPTVGTWHLRLRLSEVGQCPESEPEVGIPSQDAQQRATLCRLAVEQHNGGPGGTDDPGNPFTLSKVEYTYYEVQVSEP